MSPPVYPVIPVLRDWARSAYLGIAHEPQPEATHKKTFTILDYFVQPRNEVSGWRYFERSKLREVIFCAGYEPQNAYKPVVPRLLFI